MTSPKAGFAEFAFGPSFQEQMLAIMLADLSLAIKATKWIPKDRLFSEAHQYLFERIAYRVKKDGTTPTMVEIEDHLKSVEKHRRRMLKNFCQSIYDLKITSAEYVKDKLTDYAKRNAFIDIFQSAQTFYNSKKHEEAFSYVMEGIGDLYTINFKEDAAISIEQFEEIRQVYLHNSMTSVRRIPTNIEPLDEILRGGLEKGELGILVAEPKKGKCLAISTICLLGDGSARTLGDIISEKERSILSFNEETGCFEKDEIIDWIESGEKPVFDLRTTSSVIRLTENHPLLTLSGWKPLKDLKPKEQVFVPRRLPHGGESSISDERLTLLAYMLADGTMNKGWSWSKSNPAMIAEFEECHTKEFRPKIFDRDFHQHYPVVEMRRWFEELRLIGCSSGTKFIPAIVERQNKEKVAHFLNKLFTCDGSAEASGNLPPLFNRGQVSYSSKSHRMISQIQSLLLRFAIPSSLRTKVIGGETYFEIGLQGQSAIDFQREISMSHSKGERIRAISAEGSGREYVQGFSPELWGIIWSECADAGMSRRGLWEKTTGLSASDRQHHFKQGRVSLKLLIKINQGLGSKVLQKIIDGEWIMTTIESITPAGVEMTYDIEVKKNHNFVAENIVVHNSIGLIHMGSAALMMRSGRVAHFVLEGTTEQTVLRYQTRLTEILYRDLEVDSLNVKQRQKVQDIAKKYMGRLDLIPMNQHWTYTALDVESKIKELKRVGRSPDLVVIDYADLLHHHERTENARQEQTQVFRALKRVAMIHQVATWTASQAQRPKDSNDKETILRARDIAECIGRGSLVLTEYGHIPIEDVAIGTRVLTHTGQWKRVTNKWDKGIQETLALRPFGRLPVPMTPDHLVFDGKRFVESKSVARAYCPRFETTDTSVSFSVSKETGFDVVGDLCGILNRREYYGAHEIRNKAFSKKTHPIKNLIPLNSETAWLFGFILAEGCICQDGRTVTITSPSIERASILIEKYFGLKMKEIPRGKKCKELRITNRIFNSFLAKIIGRGSKTKFVHPLILQHDVGLSFVDGVDSGDGYEGHKRLSLSNKKVIFDLSAMLHARGFATFISSSKKSGYDDCYILSWSEIGKHSMSVGGGYTVEVNRESREEIEVWDLEVEDDHSFIVEGIAVHNCFEKVRIADLVCTLNQTQRERRHGIMRFCVDIYRSSDTDKIIRLVQDYERMIFYSKRLGHISKDEAPSWKKE